MKVILFCLFCLFMACNSNSVPKKMIQPELMGKVLFSLNMAEEFVNSYVAKDSSRNKEQELAQEYQKVFLFFQVTKEDFEKSYEYYKKNPELFKVLLDTLDARGQRRRMDLYQPQDQ